ncbi:MAG: helix-turn-helix domain-containing protein [Patulibacter minatonensis]
MAEIGAALREARSRARIEIAQMEAQTKIRAKYLRALENEEWELLPGPTYVKSFLRTYGDMLGLDGRTLVAEYKRSQEPFHGPEDLGHFSKHTGGRMAPNQRPIGLYASVVVVLLILAIGGGYALTRGSNGTDTGAPADTAVASSPSDVPGEVVTVTLTAQKAVSVCAKAGSRELVASRELKAGERAPKLRGRSILVTLSSRDVALRVDGTRTDVPAATGAVSFTVTSSGVVRAPASTTACR